MWMVRSNGGDYASDFVNSSIVAVGWSSAGNLSGLDRQQILERITTTWPEWKRMKCVTSAGQLNRLVNVMKTDDPVVTYDPSSRIYSVGKVVGNYEHDPSQVDGLSNRRAVEWKGTIKRDDLSTPSKNSLGSILSVFEVPTTVEKEINELLSGNRTADEPEEFSDSEVDLNIANLFDDLNARAKEFIKDRVSKLDWDGLQELVAGILRAMNYKTKVSPKGADRGKDIIASPDGLGFESPRIVVEVKHRPTQRMGSQEIRSFLGGRHRDERGLYVSTGGFSNEAKYEAERASIPLTLMDLDELVEILIEYYDQLDLKTRTLVPLNRIYWPLDAAQQSK